MGNSDERAAEELARIVTQALNQSLQEDPRADPEAPPDFSDTNPWPEIIGPCFTNDTLAALLGASPERIEADANELRLLRVISRDGVDLYPAFQLEERQAVEGLSDVLHALREGIDSPLTWAMWLTGRNPTSPADPNPARRIDRLRGGATREVLREAQHTAWAWR